MCVCRAGRLNGYEWPLGAALIALALSILIPERKRVRERAYVPVPARNAGRSVAGGPVKAAGAVAVLMLLCSSVFGTLPGINAYQQGKFEDAYKEFQDTLKSHPQSHAEDQLQFDSGTAAYKLKDYNKALESFSQALLTPDAALQTKGHYNLGNTLYQRGEMEKSDDKKLSDWTNALDHYEQTLKLDPQNKEAKDNYEYVKKKIDELKNKKEQQQQPSPSPTPPQKNNRSKISSKKIRTNRTKTSSNNRKTSSRKIRKTKNNNNNSSSSRSSNSDSNSKTSNSSRDRTGTEKGSAAGIKTQQSQDKSGSDKDQKKTTAKGSVSGEKTNRKKNSSNSPVRVRLHRPAPKNSRRITLHPHRDSDRLNNHQAPAKAKTECSRRHREKVSQKDRKVRRKCRTLSYPRAIATEEICRRC